MDMDKVKLFGKWSFSDVSVQDLSLQNYICVKTPQYLPHSSARYNRKSFRKANCPIVERMVNQLMMHGRNTGKKLLAVRVVKHALEIIHLLTGKNPVQVLATAVANAGPREDSTRIGAGGVVRRQAVDVSPIRRVNQGIYLIAMGARESAFRNPKTLSECLAEEIINSANNDMQLSFAIRKKDEIERVAKANR